MKQGSQSHLGTNVSTIEGKTKSISGSSILVEEKAVKLQSLNMYEAPSVESLEVNL